MKVLEIKNVHKIYNSSEVKVHAVNDISLDFEKAPCEIQKFLG